MKVRFVPQNLEFDIKPGETVLHVAQDHGVYIKSVCRGVPSCAECRVRVVEGEHNVLQPTSSELSLIGTAHFVDRRRLSCQLKCYGDITVDLSEQIEKEKKAMARSSRSRAGADELAISRASASEAAGVETGDALTGSEAVAANGGAGLGDGGGGGLNRRYEFERPRQGGTQTLAHDASADELLVSGDGLGPDDDGGDDVEGERDASDRGVRPSMHATTREFRQGSGPQHQGGTQGRGPGQRQGGGQAQGGKRKRRRGRRGGGQGRGPGGAPGGGSGQSP